MIQRIQTLFIMIVVILQSLLAFLPIIQTLNSDGIIFRYKPLDELSLTVLCSITSLIALVSIFLYKNRILQMRITIFNAIVLFALQAYIVYYLITFSNNSESSSYLIPAIFPLVSLVLSILAARKILKDELLIKALDRIR